MPPAARIGDMHICPMVTGVVPHVGGPIAAGAPTVLIGMMPAARQMDMCVCVGPPDMIAKGSLTVQICGMPAARMGDPTMHGGVIAVGFPTVLIGDVGMGGVSPTAAVAPPITITKFAMCFDCRGALIEQGKQHEDPDVVAAANDLNRLQQDAEYAKLSGNVYGSDAPPPGWSNISDNPEKLAKYGLTKSDLTKSGSDFRAQVYEPDPAVFGDTMKPTIAFKGTTTGEDWKNNLKQGVGMQSDYYENAVKIGNKVGDSGNASKVHMTGHSLGGGLASGAATASGSNATTFNAAGLKSSTVEKYNGEEQPTQINAYRVEGEVLTGIQEQGWKGTAAAAAAGSILGPGAILGGLAKIVVSALAPDAKGTKYDIPPTSFDPVRRHLMADVNNGMEQKLEEAESKLESATGTKCNC